MLWGAEPANHIPLTSMMTDATKTFMLYLFYMFIVWRGRVWGDKQAYGNVGSATIVHDENQVRVISSVGGSISGVINTPTHSAKAAR